MGTLYEFQFLNMDSEYYEKLGDKRLAKGDNKRALNDFTRAIRLNPNKSSLYLKKAAIRIKDGSFEKAIKEYDLLINIEPNNYIAYLKRGECKQKQKDYKSAINDFRKSSELGNKEADKFIDALNKRIKAKENSIHEVSLLIEANPENSVNYYDRAIVKSQLCIPEYISAIDDLDTAIKIDDQFEDAYRYRAWFKSELPNLYQQSDIDCDHKRADSLRDEKLVIEAKKKADNERRLNPVSGTHLASVSATLGGVYSDEEVAIACGYFKMNREGLKTPCLDKYRKANLIALKKEVHDVSKVEGLAIFKTKLCQIDDEHGGTVFIPKRIVEDNKKFYEETRLNDFNVDWLIKKECFDEDEASKNLAEYGFKEPMMVIEVDSYWFLDNQLEWDECFEYEEQAEIYGLRYEDCDESSSWCDG